MFKPKYLAILYSAMFIMAQASYAEESIVDGKCGLKLEMNYLKAPDLKDPKESVDDVLRKKMLLMNNFHANPFTQETAPLYISVEEQRSISTQNRAMVDEFEKAQLFKKKVVEQYKDNDSIFKMPGLNLGLRIDLPPENNASTKKKGTSLLSKG
jgi:hypothetical protein